ncbi:hypothetical protein GE061_010150 [Apolygus lucorum]|uniref:RWD domain-containing protein n=1 Tax=Apolygus lucorum TaxID=248454 RepID=A0A8S9Y4A4_APOLU|nr:hypothetical protein GE061_010150 [Apolygus lucorum]
MIMATRWSSEYTVAEHRDLQASAMAVDCTGTYVLLAGRRYFGLKNLIDQTDSLKKLPRNSKFDVTNAEWNPHTHQKELCAITTNQKVEVHSLHDSGLNKILSLSAHTRVVSSLNWNQFDANLLASCSIDTFTYIWDLRDPKRPAMSLSNVAGANQVRWNKQSRFLLATAHGGDVKLWDQRKGTAPVQYITAHLSNIHCLDWNPYNENQLATSSQDCSVKFFDTANPKRAESVLDAVAPVWRARYTPFGNGILMVVVPPMRRGENSLLLWNLANQTAPVHTFVGHNDIVLEFEWRKRPESMDYQLITWSKDQTLRIWQIEPFLQKLCGIENGNEVSLDNVNHSDGLLPTPPVVNSVESTVLVDGCNQRLEMGESASDCSTPPPSSLPKSLHQEFSLINIHIRNVTFDLLDPIKRKCTVTAAANGAVVIVYISFPPGYPQNVAPVFQIAPSSSIDSALKAKLLKVLRQTAQQRVKKNRSCLEPCIRQMSEALDEALRTDDSDQAQFVQIQGALLQHPSLYSFRDAYIPFPRTSGAKFCNVGMLVCFGRSSNVSTSLRTDKTTPRSLSALNNYSESPLTVPSYYFNERGQARPRINRSISKLSQKGSKTSVMVYDAAGLFPMRKDLAQKYVFDSHNVVLMCQKNSQVARSLGRKDLSQVWSLAAQVAAQTTCDEDEENDWEGHPVSLGIIHSLINHYVSEYDVQTAAMLCCAFGNKVVHPSPTPFAQKTVKTTNVSRFTSRNWWRKPGGSPYHTIHQVDSSVESLNLFSVKQNRSNSWSESMDDFRVDEIVIHSPLNTESEKPIKVCLADSPVYEHYKMAYSEILHHWYLLDARAQVMKYVNCKPEVHQGLEPVAECSSCKQKTRECHCATCKIPTIFCIICHIPVKGAANSCLVCGHGGHLQHIAEWFSSNSVCPTGCGCQCVTENTDSQDL